ncbi:MAG: hypothetical protein IAF94_03880 [Pirellulaceae bacterium]|nr:hypothetical protein [Pirellulaceae bacterium]
MPSEELTVYYPSGKSLSLFGRFVKHGKLKREQDARYGVAIESLESVVVENNDVVSPGSILLLDPRGVVRGKESGEIYTPRPHMHDFPGEMRDWMESNPDWPARLYEDGRRNDAEKLGAG